MTELKEDTLQDMYSKMKPFALGIMSQKTTTASQAIWDLWQSMQMQTLAVQCQNQLSKETIDTWYNLIDELGEIKEHLEDLDALIDKVAYSGDDE